MLLHEITLLARHVHKVTISMQHMGVLKLPWSRDSDGFCGLAHNMKFNIRVGGQLQLGRSTDGLIAVHRDRQFDGWHYIARSGRQWFALREGSACACRNSQHTKPEQYVSHQEHLDKRNDVEK